MFKLLFCLMGQRIFTCYKVTPVRQKKKKKKLPEMSRHKSSGRRKVLHNTRANLFPSPLTKSHSKSTLEPFFSCQPVKWNQHIYLPSCVFIQCAGIYMSQERRGKKDFEFIMSDNMSLPNNRKRRSSWHFFIKMLTQKFLRNGRLR